MINNFIVTNENNLLSLLDKDVLTHLEHFLKKVYLPFGKVLYEPNEKINHIYFPITAIISLVYITKDGQSTEIAVIGNEGLVGISLFMGGNSTTNRAVVQNAGYCFQLSKKELIKEFNKGQNVHKLLLKYTQALLTQISQISVCNKHHTIFQQLCRWILLSLDRATNNKIIITQELIAQLLGVRRSSINAAAILLKKAGLIKYTRGNITILNRFELELMSCECYFVIKKEYSRLLPSLCEKRRKLSD